MHNLHNIRDYSRIASILFRQKIAIILANFEISRTLHI